MANPTSNQFVIEVHIAISEKSLCLWLVVVTVNSPLSQSLSQMVAFSSKCKPFATMPEVRPSQCWWQAVGYKSLVGTGMPSCVSSQVVLPHWKTSENKISFPGYTPGPVKLSWQRNRQLEILPGLTVIPNGLADSAPLSSSEMLRLLVYYVIWESLKSKRKQSEW